MLITLMPSLPQPGKHHANHAARASTDPFPAAALREDEPGVGKEVFVQVGKVQAVLVDIGEAFWLVPYDPHSNYVYTFCARQSTRS
jgi:hypothetical protein